MRAVATGELSDAAVVRVFRRLPRDGEASSQAAGDDILEASKISGIPDVATYAGGNVSNDPVKWSR